MSTLLNQEGLLSRQLSKLSQAEAKVNLINHGLCPASVMRRLRHLLQFLSDKGFDPLFWGRRKIVYFKIPEIPIGMITVLMQLL